MSANPIVENHQSDPAGDEIRLGEVFAILRPHWRKILLLSFSVGVVTLLAMFLSPNIYQATAVITPASDEKKPIPALGALASIGIEIGSPTKVEDLETLFRSKDLAARVIGKHNLLPIVSPNCIDAKSGNIKVGLIGRLFRGEKGPRPPTDWDAIRVAEDRLRVSVHKKAGTLLVSFDSPSAEGSANIVRYFLDEAKTRLQEEALDRATKNKKFIEQQIGKTVDPLTRDRLYSLYGQEVEREMLARNREQFGFRVIDSPRVPDRKSRPQRLKISIGATTISFLLICLYHGFKTRRTAVNLVQ